LLLVLVAFTVLVVCRLCSLVLGTEKPESPGQGERKVVRVAIPVVFETLWALGTGTMGGLLLT
jgi:hypothetical protein